MIIKMNAILIEKHFLYKILNTIHFFKTHLKSPETELIMKTKDIFSLFSFTF